MSLSTKTKTAISQRVILSRDDLYPDREATPNSSGGYDIRDVGATVARLPDDIPRTTKDMSEMYKWKYGDEVYGSHAKSHPAMKKYRRDIEREYGVDRDDVYVDTFKLVSKELDRIEKLRR